MNSFSKETNDLIDSLKPDWHLLIPRLPATLRSSFTKVWRADLLSAATVAMVSIPQAVGFALIAGLPPDMVFTCVVVGGFVASLFFSSRHLVFGPSNSLSMLLAATFIAHRGSALGPAEMAVVLALMIGLFQITAGCFRLGQITQYISRSVVIGYGAAIGVLLMLSQIHNLLGLSISREASAWSAPFDAAGQLLKAPHSPYPIMVALAAALLFHFIKKRWPRSPDTLIGLVLCSLFSWALDLNTLGVLTLGGGGTFFATLPNFEGLPVTFSELFTLRALLGPAAAIALLGMLEAVSIAKTYGMKSGDRVDTNQELVAMGLGNLACACFAGMPGSASFARSAANFQAGARTQLSGLLSSLLVLGLVLLLSPLISHIPVPALAAALMRIGFKIIDRDQIRIAARSTRSDAVALGGTFLSALLLPLDTAIFVGVGLTLALALRKVSTPTLAEYSFDGADQLTQLNEGKKRSDPQIAIIHVEGELFFGAADIFQEHVREQVEREDLRVVILRLKNARHLDATTIFALRGLVDFLRQTGRHLLISGIHGDVLQVLRRSGLLKHIGVENIFPAEDNYALATKKALVRARSLLDGQKAEIRIFNTASKGV